MIIASSDGSFCILDPGSLDSVFRALRTQGDELQFLVNPDVCFPIEALQEVVEGISKFGQALLEETRELEI